MSELLVNLLALNKGLKPCILWDYIVASPSKLSRLASQACVGVPGVMDLGGDFVMYDRSVIRDHLQDFVVKPPLVVDVSKSRLFGRNSWE